MNVAALIGICIAMVVGVNLIPIVTQTISDVNAAGGTPAAVLNLMALLPIVLVAILIIGAVSYIAWGK
jgi:hypothetical protein